MAGEAREAITARRDALLQHGVDPASPEIKDLEAALHRIDRGVWGRCQECDGAIGRDRLRAVPEARLCLSCER